VVKDYVQSCRKAGLQAGLYASVTANAHWEVNNPGLVNWGKGGDAEKQGRYVKMSEQMLAELWSRYGPLGEIWFDGGALPPAQGGPDLVSLQRRLQPGAMVFQGPAATIRWIGNEDGVAGYPCWATVKGRDDAGNGDPDGGVWQPGECDVPIRNHDWFWHPNAEGKLYTLEQLVDMYYRSVGRNCNLLLNANIDRNGLVPEADMRRYRQFGDEIRRRFGRSIAETNGRGMAVELALPGPTRVDHVIAMEDILEGQRVREYVIEALAGGQWQELARGTSIGHKRIDRFEAKEVARVRWRCLKSVGEPRLRKLAVYAVGAAPAGG
jgi:alpha-L-fucosidase